MRFCANRAAKLPKMNPADRGPQVLGIVETCINVSDTDRGRRFYQSLFDFEMMHGDERCCAFRVGNDVLLLFKQGASENPVRIAGGIIPPHATHGAAHFAFSIAADSLDHWRALLTGRGIKIESEVRWERGGHSLYFRDPDNNLVELVTPGTWPNY
jgi:catechol 2,3-dioxygenase-like lactoylglutathione lyase family enzyme